MPQATQTFTNSNIGKFEVNLCPGLDGNNIYFTGGRLTGSVAIDVKYPVKVLKIVFKWVQVAKLGTTTKKTSERVVIFGKDKNSKAQTLGVQHHIFPVSLELPENLLPSVKCNSHVVRYYCQASIVRRFMRKPWSTAKQEFSLYQDNASIRTSIALLQDKEDHEKLLKPLRLSYQLLKTGFYIGETPTIVGEIYNSGKSPVCLKMGIDVLQTTKVDGEVNLLVTKLRMKSKKNKEGFGPWSREIKIGPMETSAFTAEMNLLALPPTTHCLNIDITYQVILKISMDRALSILKPRQELFSHDIVIACGDASRPRMRRTASAVSFGKASLKKTRSPGSRVDRSFEGGAKVDQSFEGGSSLANQSLPHTYQYGTPPPAYKTLS